MAMRSFRSDAIISAGTGRLLQIRMPLTPASEATAMVLLCAWMVISTLPAGAWTMTSLSRSEFISSS